jgi:hypothetical protein
MEDLWLIAFSSRPAAVLPSVPPDAVGTLHHSISERNTQPTDTPVQRFEGSLATAPAWLGARVVRYSIPVYPGAIQAERLCHIKHLQPTVAQDFSQRRHSFTAP